ncbi:MAG: pyridoxal phosphate-dependent aminotransferase, partial [Synergistaceae bacterium]|nr:pyridoxal phosphate-dependent aminotransferase [Synergistaceae bacterium]
PPTYDYDINLIEDGFKQGAKAIVICNPSNPCGKVFTEKELTEIGALAVKYDAFIITDEVYEHIVFDPYKHVYASGLPGLFDHVITCNSLSKTYSITGWRLGYLIGPADVVDGARKVHDFLTVGAAAPLQEAAVHAFQLPQEYYDALKAKYTKLRNMFLEGLDAAGLKHNVPQGSYFVMVDISDFLKLDQFKGWTDLEFCEWVIKNIGVAAVPGSSFFREPINNLIRFHFARTEDILSDAITRLQKLGAMVK